MASGADTPDSGNLDTKTTRMLGLFMAALLVVTAGCGSSEPTRAGHVHVDRNNDGYCDEDGEPMPRSGGGHYYGGTYYGTPGYGSPGYGSHAPTAPAGSGHAATITGGSAPHGGIGSTHVGGGG